MLSTMMMKSSCSKTCRRADAWGTIMKSAFDFCHFRRSISLPVFYNFVILSSKMITLITYSPNSRIYIRDIAWKIFLDIQMQKKSHFCIKVKNYFKCLSNIKEKESISRKKNVQWEKNIKGKCRISIDKALTFRLFFFLLHKKRTIMIDGLPSRKSQ